MKAKRGRPPGSGTIFRDKVRGNHGKIQCRLSPAGLKALEAARGRLMRLAKCAAPPSNSDVVEFLARGVEVTKSVLHPSTYARRLRNTRSDSS